MKISQEIDIRWDEHNQSAEAWLGTSCLGVAFHTPAITAALAECERRNRRIDRWTDDQGIGYVFSGPVLSGLAVKASYWPESQFMSWERIKEESTDNFFAAALAYHRTAYVLQPDECYPPGELPRKMQADEIRMPDGSAGRMATRDEPDLGLVVVCTDSAGNEWWHTHVREVQHKSHPCSNPAQAARAAEFLKRAKKESDGRLEVQPVSVDDGDVGPGLQSADVVAGVHSRSPLTPAHSGSGERRGMTPSERCELWPRFASLWGTLGCGNATGAFDRLVGFYEKPGRHYHTLTHVLWGLRRIDEISRHEVGKCDLQNVRCAMWFHDAVMHFDHAGGKHDQDEQLSADLARELLTEAGAKSERVEAICSLILETAHIEKPSTVAAAILVDADLSMLGASANSFDRYEALVRQEWGAFSEEEFRAGRIKVLERFLAKRVIFTTAYAYLQWEGPARANLARSLARLKAEPTTAPKEELPEDVFIDSLGFECWMRLVGDKLQTKLAGCLDWGSGHTRDALVSLARRYQSPDSWPRALDFYEREVAKAAKVEKVASVMKAILANVPDHDDEDLDLDSPLVRASWERFKAMNPDLQDAPTTVRADDGSEPTNLSWDGGWVIWTDHSGDRCYSGHWSEPAVDPESRSFVSPDLRAKVEAFFVAGRQMGPQGSSVGSSDRAGDDERRFVAAVFPDAPEPPFPGMVLCKELGMRTWWQVGPVLIECRPNLPLKIQAYLPLDGYSDPKRFLTDLTRALVGVVPLDPDWLFSERVARLESERDTALARAEKAEVKLSDVVTSAERAGWNGTDNSKFLSRFIEGLAEERTEAQARVHDLETQLATTCAALTRMEAELGIERKQAAEESGARREREATLLARVRELDAKIGNAKRLATQIIGLNTDSNGEQPTYLAEVAAASADKILTALEAPPDRPSPVPPEATAWTQLPESGLACWANNDGDLCIQDRESPNPWVFSSRNSYGCSRYSRRCWDSFSLADFNAARVFMGWK